MKRIDNLYDKIISLKNLRLADENARRGKTNTYGVKVHDKNREQKLMRKSIKQNFCREAARLNKREKPLSQKAYKQAVCPWLGWAKHSNSRHLLKTIIKQKYYGIL